MCEYEPVSCKYAKVGCETTPLRINLSKHEEDDRLHLQVTAEKVLELTSFVSKSTIRSNTVPRTIRLTNYLKHKRDKDEFYGPPFYTSYNGYKICLKVYANNGNHVSVFSCLMKGPNDDSLSWPFTGTVTVELQNPQAMCVVQLQADTVYPYIHTHTYTNITTNVKVLSFVTMYDRKSIIKTRIHK